MDHLPVHLPFLPMLPLLYPNSSTSIGWIIDSIPALERQVTRQARIVEWVPGHHLLAALILNAHEYSLVSSTVVAETLNKEYHYN
jgi:hypothetical protein